MEVWKEIIGFEGYYAISNLGNVKALERQVLCRVNSINTYKEKPIKIFKFVHGYEYVCLSKKGKVKKERLHRLLAIHFIPNPENKPFINHLNGIRDDNRIENLEWCTHSENMKHKFVLGNQSNAGGNNGMSKRVIEISTGKVYQTVNELAEKLGFNRKKVRNIINTNSSNYKFA